MRPTRPTGLVPIATHALNASTHHGLGASRHPPALRSLYSLPGWPGVAVENSFIGQLGKGGGQGKKSTSVSEFLTLPASRWKCRLPALSHPLAACLEGEHSQHLKIGCADAPRVSEPGVGQLGSSSHQSGA